MYNAQMIRTWSLLLRNARRSGYLVQGRQDTGQLVESPYLMHPVESGNVALYREPVATLDFASLYPSLYRWVRLCVEGVGGWGSWGRPGSSGAGWCGTAAVGVQLLTSLVSSILVKQLLQAALPNGASLWLAWLTIRGGGAPCELLHHAPAPPAPCPHQRAHNLCYTTLLHASDVIKLDPADVFVSPSGAAFVRPGIRRGILPEILAALMSARAATRAPEAGAGARGQGRARLAAEGAQGGRLLLDGGGEAG
jgi:hypothetical protein